MKFSKSNGEDKSPKKTWTDFLSFSKITSWLKKPLSTLKTFPSTILNFYRKTNITAIFLLLGIGFLFGAFWHGKDYGKAEELEEQASVVYVEANDLKDKADRQAYTTRDLEKKNKIKDQEIEYLKAQVVSIENLLELTKTQNEALELRDQTIRSLKIENNHLRASLTKMEEAYLVQKDASEAYKQAIRKEKIISFGWGSAVGAALAFVILK